MASGFVLESPPDAAPRRWDRREFLLVGAALAAVPLLGGGPGIAGADGEEAAAGVAPRPLSVGYLVGSDRLERLPRLPGLPRALDGGGAGRAAGDSIAGAEVVPASGLGIGDQRLAGESVRVRIAGFYPGAAAARDAGVESVSLWVLFPSPDPASAEPIPYLAWSFDLRPAPTAAAPVAFTLPLELDGGLQLALSVVSRPGPGAEAGRRLARVLGAGRAADASPAFGRLLTTRFTVDWAPGAPRLQRGVYLLGLAPGTWERPATLPARGEPARPDLLSLALTVEPLAGE